MLYRVAIILVFSLLSTVTAGRFMAAETDIATGNGKAPTNATKCAYNFLSIVRGSTGCPEYSPGERFCGTIACSAPGNCTTGPYGTVVKINSNCEVIGTGAGCSCH